MPRTVQVRRLHDWAILPFKSRVNRTEPRNEAELLEANFRFHRNFRHAEACPPWVLGQGLGWTVASPVSLTVSPLDDVQVASGTEEELREAGRLFGRDEFWRRGEGYIATARNEWLRTCQYRGGDGRWQGMFVPNGQGTAEWRLGWSIRIPDDHFLLVTGLDEETGVAVPTGVLTDRQANRSWDEGGFSLAIEPKRSVTLIRGQPVARLVLLSRDSLHARIEEHEPDVSDEGEAP